MDLGSKQAIVDRALPAQASAARVIRSCSRFCPPLSIVPNPAADPGADAIHATTTRNATSLQRRRRTSRPPYRHHPELATPPTRPRRGITRGCRPRWRRRASATRAADPGRNAVAATPDQHPRWPSDYCQRHQRPRRQLRITGSRSPAMVIWDGYRSHLLRRHAPHTAACRTDLGSVRATSRK